MEGAVNLKEWVRLDSIEELLNSYNQRLSSQELKISTLQKLCEGFITKQASSEQFEVPYLLNVCILHLILST